MKKVFKTSQDLIDRIEELRGSDKDLNAYTVKENGDRDEAFRKWLRDHGCSEEEIEYHLFIDTSEVKSKSKH